MTNQLKPQRKTFQEGRNFQLDRNSEVDAWAKNDHLGFEIPYIFQGVVHKYRPDYLVRLKNGDHLLIEVKGQETEKDRVKWDYLKEWLKAVNQHGGFGKWEWKAITDRNDLKDKI